MPDHGCLPHKQGQFTLPGARDHYAPDLRLEPLAIALELCIDLEARSLAGEVRTQLRATGLDCRTLCLDACDFSELEVSDSAGKQLVWRYDGRQLSVCWDEPFAADEIRELSVRYRVDQPVTGLYFSLPDADYPDRPRFAITDHETERARYWLPCVDHPNSRTTFDARITAPAELTILAGGLLQEETAGDDGSKTAHWVLDYPCPSYLYCFAVGEFVRADDESVDGTEIAYFSATREQPEDLLRSFGRTPKMMRWLTERLGAAFPFPKYYQIALPDVCGAMENISLVTWDQRFVLDQRLSAEYGHTVDQINIHEMAHSFFGDAIVIRDFASAWLKESWATYIECCWLEAEYGADEMAYELYRKAELYFEEVKKKYARPIVTRHFNSSWDMYDRHLYPGGAWRIHMLRKRLGEEVFWAAVTDYVETFSRGLVETSDFVRKLEAHSGENLGQFFDQWIYRPGYPRLKISFTQDQAHGEGTFQIEQTQVDEAAGIGLFSFDLVIAVEQADGSWERASVALDRAQHQLTLPVDQPRQICIDPDNQLLFELEMNPGDDLLRCALTEGPTVSSRILAGRELAKTGKRANCEAVGRAYAAEPVWGVRVELARNLAASGAAEAIGPLAEMLDLEQDPRVMLAVASACGEMRHARLAEALETFLKRPALPYMAHAAALVALGEQRDPTRSGALDLAATDNGWRAMVQAGALSGLGRTRTRAAYDQLLSAVVYGALPEAARPAALAALAEAASWQARPEQQQAAARLIELTQDASEVVRLSAAAGLARLALPEGVAAIEAMTGGVAAQEQPRLDRHIATIRKGADPHEASIKLRQTVEELQEKLRQLDARMQSLEGKSALS